MTTITIADTPLLGADEGTVLLRAQRLLMPPRPLGAGSIIGSGTVSSALLRAAMCWPRSVVINSSASTGRPSCQPLSSKRTIWRSSHGSSDCRNAISASILVLPFTASGAPASAR